MLTRLLLFCLLSTLYYKAFAQKNHQEKGETCISSSQTPPGELNGQIGASSTDKYWFEHIADVDEQNHKYRIRYWIKNLHSEKYLPAKWIRGDGEVQVYFSRIAPNRCAFWELNGNDSYQKDAGGLIKYGPVVALSKEAPLYISVANPKPRQGSPLTSRLIADLTDHQGHNNHIHIEFTTEFQNGKFLFTAINYGTKNESLRIPILNEIRQNNGDVMTVLEWPLQGNILQLNRTREPHVISFTVNEKVSYEETPVKIDIINRDLLTNETTTEASLFIVLYLPIRN